MLFYVPTILVIDVKPEEDISNITHQLLTSLAQLRPEHFGGHILLEAFASTPAASDWDTKTHNIHITDNLITIFEE